MALPQNNSLNVGLNVSNLVRPFTPIPTFEEEDPANLTFYVFDLGPKRDSLSSVIPITVIYMLILISGLVGNICTCVVIIRNKHMHTATNYYLFSLAVSDLLLLVMGLPQELYLLWNKYPYAFGEAFCIIRGFTSEMSTNASILTITSFTMERYLAICHPLKTHTMSKLSRAVYVIVGAWIIGGVSAIPMAIQFGIVIKDFKGEMIYDTAECTVKNPVQHAFVSSTFVFFIIPMIVISLLYAWIGIQLRASNGVTQSPTETIIEPSENQNGNGRYFSLKKMHMVKLLNRQSTRSIRGIGANSRKAVIKMLFAVVVAFFICWAPFHAQRLMAIYVHNQTPTAVMIYTTLTYISGVTYYVSATINPILYSIMSNKFRQAFKDTLAHCCRKNVYYDRTSSRYSSYRLSRSSAPRSTQSSFHNSNSYKKRKPENQILHDSSFKNTTTNEVIPDDIIHSKENQHDCYSTE